ncbi:MAG: hypothetical protein WCK65_10870 [Rhodospirillaceae bacterium]
MAVGSKIWTVRGIPAELQTSVSVAAKTARQTLGEWTATALNVALAGEPQGTVRGNDGLATARLDGLEARLTQLERRIESIDSRSQGMEFRVDGLEHRDEGHDGRISTLLQRLDSLESRGLESRGLESRGFRGPNPPPMPNQSTADQNFEPPPGPFTRGIGSRKRLTSIGEEELQRLLSAGVDDATIATRLGIHKRIVWARRLTESPD